MQWPRGTSIIAAPKPVNKSRISLAQPQQNGGRAMRDYSGIVLLGSPVRCFPGQVGLNSLFVDLCLTSCPWALPRSPHRSFDPLNHLLSTYYCNVNKAATQSSVLTWFKQSIWVANSLFHAPPKSISNAQGLFVREKIRRRFNYSGAYIRNSMVVNGSRYCSRLYTQWNMYHKWTK